jgi:hypothetical protein
VTIQAPRLFVKSDRKGGGLDFVTGPPNATVGLMIEVIPLSEFKDRKWTTVKEYFDTIQKKYTPYEIRDREWGMLVDAHRY